MIPNNTKFLYGVFGSGELPALVPPAENSKFERAISNGTHIMSTAVDGYNISILSQVKARVYECGVNFRSINAEYAIRHGFCNEKIEFINQFREYMTKYAGHTYVIYVLVYGKQYAGLGNWNVYPLMNMFNMCMNYYNKVSVLHGTFGAYDLSEKYMDVTELMVDDMVHRNIVQLVQPIWPGAIETFIISDTYRPKHRHLRRTTAGLEGTRKLDRYMKWFQLEDNVYVISTHMGALMPRVYGPHLELLYMLITPEQAAIYCDDPPNDDDITYDDRATDEEIIIM